MVTAALVPVFPSEIRAMAVCTSWPCALVLSDCLRGPERPRKWHYRRNTFAANTAPTVQRQRAKIQMKTWQVTSILAAFPKAEGMRQLLMHDRRKKTQVRRGVSQERRFQTLQEHQHCRAAAPRNDNISSVNNISTFWVFNRGNNSLIPSGILVGSSD